MRAKVEQREDEDGGGGATMATLVEDAPRPANAEEAVKAFAYLTAAETGTYDVEQLRCEAGRPSGRPPLCPAVPLV